MFVFTMSAIGGSPFYSFLRVGRVSAAVLVQYERYSDVVAGNRPRDTCAECGNPF